MSHKAITVDTPDWGTNVARSRRESAGFSLELLACLAACVAFWVLVALTVYWLI